MRFATAISSQVTGWGVVPPPGEPRMAKCPSRVKGENKNTRSQERLICESLFLLIFADNLVTDVILDYYFWLEIFFEILENTETSSL